MAFLNSLVDLFEIITGRWELVLGIIALVGLLFQRVSGVKVFTGVVKTIVGVLILKLGSATLLDAFRPAMSILQEAFNITGVLMDPYGGWMAALDNLGQLASAAAQIMVLGFLVNILLARLTPLKFIYLTGHTMLAFTSFVAWILHYFFGLTGFGLIGIGAVIAGVYWTILPAWVHKYSKDMVGDQFTLGHMSGVGAIMGSWIGKFFKKGQAQGQPAPVNQGSDIKMSGFLKIFNDNIIATTLIMTVFLGGISLFAGAEIVQPYAGAENWLLWTAFLGIKFAMGITILLTGVRMMLAEIVPAFKGFSDRIIPGAVPALDMPVFFPLAPTAAILGFIATFVGEILGMLVLLATGAPVLVIPGVIPTFFDGGTLGVFANYYGGRKAVITAGLVVGVVQMFGGALLASLTGLKGAVYPNTDYTTIWVGLSGLMKILGNVWVFMAIFVILSVIAFWALSPKSTKQEANVQA